jgi:hypothetical protein
VLLLASFAAAAGTTVFLVAHTFAQFALAAAVMGIFRALDSGPLESWYVDATHAIDPRHPIERGLAASGAAVGVGIAAGSLASAGLIGLGSQEQAHALAVPVYGALAIQILLIPIAWRVLVEQRNTVRVSAREGMRGVPAVVGDSLRLLRGSRVLICLVCVELMWGFGMPAFESLTPVKLSDLLNSADEAAALMGVVGAAGWGIYALGAGSAARLGARWGMARIALLLRIAQGAIVVGMGFAGGPVLLIGAFLACYLVHGVSNPPHSTLLHRQVGPERRATVISVNSMIGQTAGAVGTIVLTLLADSSSVNMAFFVAGCVLALAAPLYLPAVHQEQEGQEREGQEREGHSAT